MDLTLVAASSVHKPFLADVCFLDCRPYGILLIQEV